MTDANDLLAVYRRYAELIEAALGGGDGFQPTVENATTVQVERGVVFAQAMKGQSLDVARSATQQVERLIELSSSERLGRLVVADTSEHHRPVYRPLLVYCWLQTFRLLYEIIPRADFGRWEEGLRPWCDLLEAELGEMELPGQGQPLTAGRGATATEAAWTALALFVAGKVFIRDAWTDLAADTFGRLTRGQQTSGEFFLATAADNPETHWYHELVLLHAAASYAVQSEDRGLAAAVKRNTAFHLAETQVDHATSQPWAAFAFIWNDETRPVADQLLHGATVQHPAGAAIGLMLLADALYCLRLFLK